MGWPHCSARVKWKADPSTVALDCPLRRGEADAVTCELFPAVQSVKEGEIVSRNDKKKLEIGI